MAAKGQELQFKLLVARGQPLTALALMLRSDSSFLVKWSDLTISTLAHLDAAGLGGVDFVGLRLLIIVRSAAPKQSRFHTMVKNRDRRASLAMTIWSAASQEVEPVCLMARLAWRCNGPSSPSDLS